MLRNIIEAIQQKFQPKPIQIIPMPKPTINPIINLQHLLNAQIDEDGFEHIPKEELWTDENQEDWLGR